MRPDKLGAILDSVLADALGLPAAALQVRLTRSWTEVVGPLLGGKTCPGRIRNGVLTIHVPNHAWAQELQLSQPALLEKIRAFAGEDAVREIRFVAAGVYGPAAPLPARGGEGPPDAETAAQGAPPAPFEPSGLEDVRDSETREILRSIGRKSARRRG